MTADPIGGTRARLVDAAARLFWERSYTAAGVDDVCKAAGARKGSFYHFFASKTALALETVEVHWAMVEEAVFKPVEAGDSRGLHRLTTLIDRFDLFQREAQTRTAAVLGSPFGHMGQEMAHQEEVLRRAVEAVFVAQCGYLERWLDEAVALEQVAPGNSRVRARQVLALIEGAQMLAKVADAPGVFRETCGNLPALMRESASGTAAVQPSTVTAPEPREATVPEPERVSADDVVVHRPASGLPEFD